MHFFARKVKCVTMAMLGHSQKKLCGWVGTAAEAVAHVVSEGHRRSQLVHRYPVLEKMIKGMEVKEVEERAMEEERKLGERRYDVIQKMEDRERHAQLDAKLRGGVFLLVTLNLSL